MSLNWFIFINGEYKVASSGSARHYSHIQYGAPRVTGTHRARLERESVRASGCVSKQQLVIGLLCVVDFACSKGWIVNQWSLGSSFFFSSYCHDLSTPSGLYTISRQTHKPITCIIWYTIYTWTINYKAVISLHNHSLACLGLVCNILSIVVNRCSAPIH